MVNSLHKGVIFHAYLLSGDFSISTFLKNTFKDTIRVSNSLDPDQARHFVGHDPGPNCLQRSSADATSRQRANRINLSFDGAYVHL